jgi:hypothetical protein
MKKKYFGYEVVFILFLCYITVTCRQTIVFYGKYCFHERYLFSVFSWNFARDISTVFEEITHPRSRAPDNILPDY